MTNPAEILPGVIFYSYLSAERKDKVCFWNHHTLVLMVSGQLHLETANQRMEVKAGEMMLVGKNQLGTLTKTPLPGQSYESIVICLQEDLLRKIALEEQIGTSPKYIGPSNVPIPPDPFLIGYFQSIIPYARAIAGPLTDDMGMLKVKEGVKLLLHSLPQLKSYLFDFAEPYKIDLERFMMTNFHFNVPIERFARLTGRSLAGFKRDFTKTFGMPPRQWLLDKRLNAAKHLIEQKHQKPSAIYLDLGFESLPHFSRSFKQKFGKAPSMI
ncbi:AraC family transcriptional regulator [Pedobacter nutrimenti]|uniref:helix-turn-helix domain-containing protein n=1 Tax=Pedobacter nutrimenti TaxID=1241337 RepID=UPI00293052BB|nr:AraC family transcriptional regulator [Pedobacter nutrimenti]